MRRIIWAILVVAVLGTLGWACTVQVAEGETVIVTRFGDPRRVVEDAGLYWRWPAPIDRVRRLDRRLHVLDPAPNEWFTADKKNLMIDGFLVWRVSNPKLFVKRFTETSQADYRLEDVLRSELRNVLAEHPMSVLVSAEDQDADLADLVRDVTDRVAQHCDELFGIEVSAVRIKRLGFPQQNRQAVFQRMRAERQRVARQYRSEGEKEARIITNEADARQAELLAEAEREAQEILGAAEAEATRISGEAFGADPEFYEFQRALKSYESIFGEDDMVVIPSDDWILRVLRGDWSATEESEGQRNEEGGE